MFPTKALSLLITLGMAIPSTIAEGCPHPGLVFPCKCDERWRDITCDGSDIVTTLDRVSRATEDKLFNTLSINYFNKATFPARAISSLKFRFIFIENSEILERIHPNAFDSTVNVTSYLSVRGNNKLARINNGNDNFEFIRRFTGLSHLAFEGRSLKSIPSEAFGSKPSSLRSLHLGPCIDGGLDSVGSRFLANLPHMTNVYLGHCNLTEHKFAPDSFEGIGSNVTLDLENNPIMTLPEAVFKPVLDNVVKLKVGQVVCAGSLCTTIEMVCDETSGWLCKNKTLYKPKLETFFCNDRFHLDIWDWCAKNAGY